MVVRTALIAGAGVAGPTLAYWLQKSGVRVTLLERAPSLRTGGYVIDFWGLGYDIAERMGITGEFDRLGYRIQEMRIVDRAGRRISGFGTNVFRELTGGRFVSIRRSDLGRLLFERLEPETETIFGDELSALEQDEGGVNVTFKHGPMRRFNLVIGADGLHSGVRKLVFGPQDRFEKSLGYTVAAFEAASYRPRDEHVYVVHNEPSTMVGRLSLRDDRTLFLLVFADADDTPATYDDVSSKAVLRRRFAGAGWESPRILDELDRCNDLYFDRVSQIHMRSWSQGRVALVGDAAFCVSLMAGQGSALAMAAAYILAGELGRPGGSHREAFGRYEALLRSFIATKQKGAKNFAGAFAPRSVAGLIVRNLVIGAIAIPGVARLAFGRDIIDKFVLPQYHWR